MKLLRRHDKSPIEKVNFKIPRVPRSKTRGRTQQDVLRTCHVLILKTKGATILFLRTKRFGDIVHKQNVTNAHLTCVNVQ